MSSLIVEVCAIEEILPIQDADRIERARVKNWWCVVVKGHYQIGSKVVYVPPDSILSKDLADRWGIAKYCSQLPKESNGERPTSLRVRASKFRGVPSFGTIQNLDDPNWEVGKDVREYYGITKYEPPIKNSISGGEIEKDHPFFQKYTGLEKYGDFPNVFSDGEEVIVTEKLHGTNCRIGYVLDWTDIEKEESWSIMAGSHNNRRKEYDTKNVRSMYWMPLMTDQQLVDSELGDPLRNMLVSIMMREKAQRSVIVFGEIFGCGVQDMQYGQKGKSFRVFDINVDGIYLGADKLIEYTGDNVKMVPILYRGPFSKSKMDELVDGPTTVCNIDEIKEPFKGREGIVIKPVKEKYDSLLGGRAILKYISADYHSRKNKNQTEDH